MTNLAELWKGRLIKRIKKKVDYLKNFTKSHKIGLQVIRPYGFDHWRFGLMVFGDKSFDCAKQSIEPQGRSVGFPEQKKV